MTNPTDFNKHGEPIADPELSEVISDAITARLLETYIHLPGTVVNYADGKADIQINIKKKFKDGTNEDIDVLSDVPVWLPRSDGGNAYLQLPIKEGDTGLIAFSQRSMDDWLVSGGNVLPRSTRMNSESDAIFFPGLYPFNNVVDENADNVVLKNNSMSIELYPDGKIKISGATSDFLSLMNDTLASLISAKVITGIGPQPFLLTTIAEFQGIKTKLEKMIP